MGIRRCQLETGEVGHICITKVWTFCSWELYISERGELEHWTPACFRRTIWQEWLFSLNSSGHSCSVFQVIYFTNWNWLFEILLQCVLQTDMLWNVCNVSECRGQISVTQTPAVKAVLVGQTIKLDCRSSSPISGCRDCVSWYLQKTGEAPKLLIYDISKRYGSTPSRFVGEGSNYGSDFSLTISNVQAEDAGVYYCQTGHYPNSKYVFTQW